MKIKDKIYMDQIELVKNGPINIVVFGDSITHGGFLDEVDFKLSIGICCERKLLTLETMCL